MVAIAQADAAAAVPTIDDAFRGTPYPLLDGSMWTILYEFRCYLLLVPLAWLGVLRRPWVLAALAALLVAVGSFGPGLVAPIDRLPLHSIWFGQAADGPRLYGIFLAGAASYAFGDRLRFTLVRVLVAAALSTAGLFSHRFATPMFALFGTYAVLGTALLGGGTWMERVNNRTDISYGVYLYGWPLTKLPAWVLAGDSARAVAAAQSGVRDRLRMGEQAHHRKTGAAPAARARAIAITPRGLSVR